MEEYPEEIKIIPKSVIGFVNLPEFHEKLEAKLKTSLKNTNIKYYKDENEMGEQKQRRRRDYGGYVPDGILKRGWISKHQSVPSLLVVLIRINLSQSFILEQERIVNKFEAVRGRVAGHNQPKFVLVILSNDTLPVSHVFDEFSRNLRQEVQLESKLIHFCEESTFESPLTLQKLDRIVELQSVQYYKEQCTRVRKLKNDVKRDIQPALYSRHRFKVGFYHEILGNPIKSLKYYKQAYDALKIITNEKFKDKEIHMVGDYLNFKMCVIKQREGRLQEGIPQFLEHMSWARTKNKFPLEHEYYKNMYKQYKMFSEIIAMSLRMGTPLRLVQSYQNPGFYYQLASEYAILRKKSSYQFMNSYKSLSRTVYPNPEQAFPQNDEILGGHKEFVGKDLLFLDSDEEERMKKSNAFQTNIHVRSICREVFFKHSEEILNMLRLSYDFFKKAKHKGFRKILLYLTSLMSEEYLEKKDYKSARDALKRIKRYYVTTQWSPILTGINRKLLTCSSILGHHKEFIKISLELLSNRFEDVSQLERNDIYKKLIWFLQTAGVEDKSDPLEGFDAPLVKKSDGSQEEKETLPQKEDEEEEKEEQKTVEKEVDPLEGFDDPIVDPLEGFDDPIVSQQQKKKDEEEAKKKEDESEEDSDEDSEEESDSGDSSTSSEEEDEGESSEEESEGESSDEESSSSEVEESESSSEDDRKKRKKKLSGKNKRRRKSKSKKKKNKKKKKKKNRKIEEESIEEEVEGNVVISMMNEKKALIEMKMNFEKPFAVVYDTVKCNLVFTTKSVVGLDFEKVDVFFNHSSYNVSINREDMLEKKKSWEQRQKEKKEKREEEERQRKLECSSSSDEEEDEKEEEVADDSDDELDENSFEMVLSPPKPRKMYPSPSPASQMKFSFPVQVKEKTDLYCREVRLYHQKQSENDKYVVVLTWRMDNSLRRLLHNYDPRDEVGSVVIHRPIIRYTQPESTLELFFESCPPILIQEKFLVYIGIKSTEEHVLKGVIRIDSFHSDLEVFNENFKQVEKMSIKGGEIRPGETRKMALYIQASRAGEKKITFTVEYQSTLYKKMACFKDFVVPAEFPVKATFNYMAARPSRLGGTALRLCGSSMERKMNYTHHLEDGIMVPKVYDPSKTQQAQQKRLKKNSSSTIVEGAEKNSFGDTPLSPSTRAPSLNGSVFGKPGTSHHIITTTQLGGSTAVSASSASKKKKKTRGQKYDNCFLSDEPILITSFLKCMTPFPFEIHKVVFVNDNPDGFECITPPEITILKNSNYPSIRSSPSPSSEEDIESTKSGLDRYDEISVSHLIKLKELPDTPISEWDIGRLQIVGQRKSYKLPQKKKDMKRKKEEVEGEEEELKKEKVIEEEEEEEMKKEVKPSLFRFDFVLPNIKIVNSPISVFFDETKDTREYVITEPIDTKLTIVNHSETMQKVEITIENNPCFLLSGIKEVEFDIFPYSKRVIPYRFVPISVGNLEFPNFFVKSVTTDFVLVSNEIWTAFVKEKKKK